jgi:signal transduction histidine kinase/CheY-like chemotaxis protein
MSRLSGEFGFEAAVRLRLRTTVLRLALMGVIGLMLWTVGHWRWAPLWFCAYAALQGVIVPLSLGGPAAIERRRNLYCVLSGLSFALAGSPTWHMWTALGDLGMVAAVMFLCGMLLQLIVGSLGARRLFWCSASPLIAYLLVLPPLAWNGPRLIAGLTLTACGLCLMAYLIALWRGYQQALERSESERVQAVAARQAAEHAAQAKSHFLATMSHEVRTPMNAVLGAARLLRETRLDQAQGDYVEMISNAGGVLMHVLDDVLDLSKIEAGKFQIEPAWTGLQPLLRRCANLWTPQAEAAGLQFELQIDPAAPRWILVDAGRLSQILFNLLSNAVKFTASGHVRLAVQAQASGPDTAALTFTVIDTGPGIEPEVMPRLFDAFEQADPSISRRFGGTGLGLAISQRLARLMGGAITVRSDLGKGSRFALGLTVPMSDRVEEPGQSAERAGPPPGLRVLVAEDNPVNRKIVGAMLSPLEPAVTFAENGAEAIEALTASVFDIVLMDIQMPVMDGVEATRRLRALDGPNARVPVIALTANVLEDQRQTYREAGMDAEVAKPVDPQSLLAAIGALTR